MGMSETSHDCVVIGAGPGGYVAAIRAAQLGLRAAVVERDAVGGRCLNYACIPAKAVLRVADVVSEIDEAADFGIEVPERVVHFSKVGERRRTVIETLTGGVRGLLKNNGVEVVTGEARLTRAGVVQVNGATLSAPTIVLATGSVKRSLSGIEFGGRVIGTEEAWALEELPASMAVVGAGASGAEIASAYGRLGTNVLLFEALERVLPTEEPDVSKVVARALARQNIELHTGTLLERVTPHDDGVKLEFAGKEADVDWLVVATGRAPDVAGLGLDQLGVERDAAGLLKVDPTMRTSVPGIYAIGDLVAGPALAHKASDEGVIAVESAAGRTTHPLSYQEIPRATFCTPNVASFGLTEAQAREQGYDVVVGKVPYGAVGAGTVYGDRAGIIKVVGERQLGELLGGHIVGAKATELIQELVNVRALEGGFPEVARIVHGHPTLAEGVMEAARAADGWLVHG
jgi:dihydrolipoamide dehydrogenase